MTNRVGNCTFYENIAKDPACGGGPALVDMGAYERHICIGG